MLHPTKDLAEALNRFDPVRPLQTPDELRDYYIGRQYSPMEPLVSYLRVTKAPVKILFMGPTGNGKSTELAKLATRMENSAVVTTCALARKVNVNDIEPVDVAFACASAFMERVAEESFLVNDPQLADLEKWLRNDVVVEESHQNQKTTELAIGASLKLFLRDLSRKFQIQSVTRETIRPRLYTRVTELAQRVNQVARAVEQHLHPPLLLVEELDKVSLGSARKVFLEEVNLLRLWDFKTIYSFPIALCYSNDYPAIKASFQVDFKLPNIKISDRNGNPHPEGLASLRDLALRRADESLFAPGSLEKASELSGGLLSDYVRMLQNAFLQALVDQVPQATAKMVESAASEIRNDYLRLLGEPHYKVLNAALEQHRVVNETAVQESFQNRSLLEYKNDVDWCDVHPIVKPLLAQS